MYTDFGYIEEGKFGKPYDLKLIAKLWKFIRPQSLLIIISLISVLIITLLDLAIPYLTKEAIDRYIINYARELFIKDDQSMHIRNFLSRYGDRLIPTGDSQRFLIPSDVVQSMDKRELERLQKLGFISEKRFYVNPVIAHDKKNFPEFISLEEMKALKKDKIIDLRAMDIRGVLRLAIIVIFIMIFNFLLNYLQVFCMELSGQRMMHDLRMSAFLHLQSLPISFFDKNPVGKLTTRLTNDIQNVHEMFSSVIVNLLKDSLLLIGTIVILLQLNKELSSISFLIIPIIFFITLIFSNKARDVFREIRKRLSELNGFLQEVLSGIKIVQLFQREKENLKRFQNINDRYFMANLRQISIYALFVPLIEVLATGMIGFIIWFGGGKVIQESLSLGTLVAFLSYMRMFFQPIRDLSEKYNILQSAIASLERIFSLMENRKERQDSADLVRKEVDGEIEFRNVSFSYNGEERVLKNISFKVRKGESLAIVGLTGAGKTTLFNLLERFYDVDEGCILVDGIDIKRWDLHKLRSQIGFVMQETFLFAGDIEENIRLGEKGVNGNSLKEVSRFVNAENFINRLPRGYQTQVGEGGERLSAGERQLLSLARALYKNPKILILDEATSNVDPETERLVQDGIKRLIEGRTSIIIAHRLSTIQNADRIVVLHKGRILEEGSHSELIARKGVYYRLYEKAFSN